MDVIETQLVERARPPSLHLWTRKRILAAHGFTLISKVILPLGKFRWNVFRPDDPFCEEPFRDDPAGDIPSGDDPSYDNLTGDDLSGDDPSGDDPSADDPTGDDMSDLERFVKLT